MGLKITDLVNGRLIGKDHIGLLELLLEMLISMKLLRLIVSGSLDLILFL